MEKSKYGLNGLRRQETEGWKEMPIRGEKIGKENRNQIQKRARTPHDKFASSRLLFFLRAGPTKSLLL